jgi:hypothetical protein
MSTPIAPAQLFALLNRFDIKAPAGRVEGGQVAHIYGFVHASGAKTIAIVHGGKRVERFCPVDDAAVSSMVEEVFGSAVYRDPSFERLIAHLVHKASRMYVEGGLDSFRLESIHLHPAGYDIARAVAFRTAPLHLGRPKEARQIVLHASFPHMPGGR